MAKCQCGRGPIKSPALGKCEACLYEETMRRQRLEADRVKRGLPAPAANVVPLRGR